MKKNLNVHAYPASPAPSATLESHRQERHFAASRDTHEDRSQRQNKMTRKGRKAVVARPSMSVRNASGQTKGYRVEAEARERLIPEHASASSAQTEFSLFRPAAKSVFLAGTFNDWDAKGIALHRDAEGTWRTRLQLAPGRHEYRFLVDASWEDDPMALRYVNNPYGTQNSVVEVQLAQQNAKSQPGTLL